MLVKEVRFLFICSRWLSVRTQGVAAFQVEGMAVDLGNLEGELRA